MLVIGGLAAATLGRGRLRAAGAWLAALTGLVLVVLNGRRFGYEGLTILALMFTGTVLYRAQRGQVSRRWAAIITGGVFTAVMAAGAWHIPALTASGQPALLQREWVMSVLLAGQTFAAGLALRHVRVPARFAWLGLISYSVYLVFPVLLDLYDSIPFPPGYFHQAWLQAGMSVLFLASLLGCAGRRAAARLDARLGPDRARAPRHAASAAAAG